MNCLRDQPNGQGIVGNIDPIHDKEIRKLQVFANVGISGKFAARLFPIIDCLAELLLFEAGIAEVVINGAAVDALIEQQAKGTFRRCKITALVMPVAFGEDGRRRSVARIAGDLRT